MFISLNHRILFYVILCYLPNFIRVPAIMFFCRTKFRINGIEHCDCFISFVIYPLTLEDKMITKN